ncbi:Flp family type IVb pilin [Vibrio jasicida]|uniref:Flp family type IVb pilin n=1 Tax=Vibrio jasicida TaxID=766224 RepID=UPI00390A7944
MFNRKLLRIVSAGKLFIIDQKGVTAIEYAMVSIFLSAMMLAVFGIDNPIKQALISAFDSVASNIGAVGSNK